jgi:tetratricopeptide (TPR) repeat protein
VKPLSPADDRHIKAAIGWCQLHSFGEAHSELEAISADHWTHPDALEVRWAIYAHSRRWDGALDLADVINQLTPDEPKGYIYASSTLCELGRCSEALDLLLGAAEQFTNEASILYGIAWLYCVSGRLDLASPWLAKAMNAGGNGITTALPIRFEECLSSQMNWTMPNLASYRAGPGRRVKPGIDG